MQGSMRCGVGWCVLSSLCAVLPAQLRWTRVGLDERAEHAMATDLLRGRVVLFGGTPGDSVGVGDTHEWDGTRWTPQRPAHRPRGRRNPALAYDLARGRTVLFGGLGYQLVGQTWFGVLLNDTWEWDGSDWAVQQPTQSPPPREQHALAYDLARNEVVLFGGRTGGSTYVNETWVWDGTIWNQRQPATSPSARVGPGMTYDVARRRVVLFGGFTAAAALLDDTWEWDGSNWSLVATGGPTPRVTGLSYDLVRQRVVLFGGADNVSGLRGDTWEWDGTAWQLHPTIVAPGSRGSHALTWDPVHRRTLVFGGARGTGSDDWSDVWEWDGVSWVQLVAVNGPAPRDNHALAYDATRQQVVLFGGLGNPGGIRNDTWTWSGERWQEATPAAGSPAPRSAHAMAFDTVRSRVVLFGGYGTASALNDTWEWDGTNWAPQFPSQSPIPSSGHAMVWDGARQRVFLYNGNNWEWDGSNWTRRQSTTYPGSLRDHAMAFDPLRGRVVLFGGVIGFPETLEWDGTNWTRMSPARHPSGRRGAVMDFDAVLGRVVLHGGADNSSTPRQLADVWDWDGTNWTQRTPAESPPQRQDLAMVYDAAQQRLVMFGGYSSWWMGDTWELAPVDPASTASFGVGCAGTAGVPALAPVLGQRPWLGDRFAVEVRNAPAAQLGVLWSGLSRTTFGGLTLPFDLRLLGMPGCSLLCSGQFVDPMAAVGGAPRAALPLPLDPALQGAVFYQQALLADPATNAAGVITSQALEHRLGLR